MVAIAAADCLAVFVVGVDQMIDCRLVFDQHIVVLLHVLDERLVVVVAAHLGKLNAARLDHFLQHHQRLVGLDWFQLEQTNL